MSRVTRSFESRNIVKRTRRDKMAGRSLIFRVSRETCDKDFARVQSFQAV